MKCSVKCAFYCLIIVISISILSIGLFSVKSYAMSIAPYNINTNKSALGNGNLIKIKGKSTVYVIYNNQRLPIRSKVDFDKLGFNGYMVREVNSSDVKSFKVGAMLSYVPIGEGTLVKTSGNSTVFLIEDGYRRPLRSQNVFTLRGYNWKDVKQAHQIQLDRYPLGVSVTEKEKRDGQLVRTQQKSTVYLMENGKKRPVLSSEAFEIRGYDWNSIKFVSQKELERYPTDDAIVGEAKPTLARVSSCDDLARLIKQPSGGNRSITDGWAFASPMGLGETSGLSNLSTKDSTNYSTTNVQVQGVDEADIVKTDGTYLYALSFGDVVISQGAPLLQAKKLSTIARKEDFMPHELLISENRMAIIGDVGTYKGITNLMNTGAIMGEKIGYYRGGKSRVYIYDISDRSQPIVRRTFEFDGKYQTSRLIGNEVYIIFNSTPPIHILENPINKNTMPDGLTLLPMFRESRGSDALPSAKSMVPCDRIHYINPMRENNYLTAVNFNISDDARPFNSLVILGREDEVYVSQNFLYIAQYNNYYFNSFGISADETRNKTSIYKIQLTPGNLTLVGSAIVPGKILNQFSMDEWDGHLRIATTAQNTKLGSGQSSNIFVYDKNLTRVGSVENLAPGEEIYSARFMGSKGFLVTFRQKDPFFTIDLSDHQSPKLVGELKIPGFSTYLHPYDENHIIGLGENESDDPGFGTTQGVKLALFDITDFANPKEIYSTVVASGQASTIAGTDHRAFLFDRDKHLLVIPVMSMDKQNPFEENISGSIRDRARNDAYVYNVTLDNGFDLKARISHLPEEGISINIDEIDDVEGISATYTFIQNFILRSLYINNNLYTYSPAKWMITSLDTFEKVGEITMSDIDAMLKQELEKARLNARDAKRISDIKQIQTALEIYKAENNQFPAIHQQMELGVDATCFGSNGLDTACTGIIVMSRISSDPQSPNKKYIIYPNVSNTNVYCIEFAIEGDTSGFKAGTLYASSGAIIKKESCVNR